MHGLSGSQLKGVSTHVYGQRVLGYKGGEFAMATETGDEASGAARRWWQRQYGCSNDTA